MKHPIARAHYNHPVPVVAQEKRKVYPTVSTINYPLITCTHLKLTKKLQELSFFFFKENLHLTIADHIINSLPTESEARYSPLGEYATESTSPVCPVNIRTGFTYSGRYTITTSCSRVPLKNSSMN